MTDYGIKISQAENDVKTCNKENLVFSSKYDSLKPFIVGYGEKTVAAATAPYGPSGEELVQIKHDLGYLPFFYVFCTSIWRSDDKFSPYAYKSIGAISPDGGSYAVDTNYLYIHLFNGDPTGSRQIFFRYHIYYNELS
ncbi:MAG: hypothetical protein WC346_04250 [Methanogenium sp.]|jgi:hypothetical protein